MLEMLNKNTNANAASLPSKSERQPLGLEKNVVTVHSIAESSLRHAPH